MLFHRRTWTGPAKRRSSILDPAVKGLRTMDVAGTLPDSRRREQTDGYGIAEIDEAGQVARLRTVNRKRAVGR